MIFNINNFANVSIDLIKNDTYLKKEVYNKLVSLKINESYTTSILNSNVTFTRIK